MTRSKVTVIRATTFSTLGPPLQDEDIEALHGALQTSNNHTLFSLDLRMNAAVSEDSELLDEITRIVHRNELEMRHQ